MKLRTRTIIVTIAAIVISIILQLIHFPSFMYTYYIIGGLINLILILDTLYCGLISGLVVAIVIPITSFIATGSSIIATVPMILPCIMIGNSVLVLFAWFVRCKKIELNLLPISLVAGSFAKWGLMILLVVKWALPNFGKGLSSTVYRNATITYSKTQLITALVGTAFACIIWPIARLVIKRSR